jgi:hypothetical protein
VLYGGVHIKEAFARRMANTQPTVQDDVAYIGLKEMDSHLQLYKCILDPKDFHEALFIKLNRKKTSTHDEITHNKQALRKYLKLKLDNITQNFGITLVTDIDHDHLLTVQDKDALFVYFGAMTAKLIHVACWLRIPKVDKKIDESKNPKIFFWVLHTAYAQELEALGDFEDTGKDNSAYKKIDLEFEQGIDFVERG